MKNLYIVASLAFLSIGATAVRADEKTCLLAAFQDYNKANVAILSQGLGVSVEIRMGQRRLEERYCLRVAECLVGPNNNRTEVAAMPFAAEFYRCLDDEAKERLSHAIK